MEGSDVRDMVSVVIPSYNEHAVADVVKDVRTEFERLGRPFEILVVDDGSTDGSADDVCVGENVLLLRHRVNRGYGASLKEGIRRASGSIVLTMDADGQHRPADIARMLQPVDDGAEAAFGSRQKALHSAVWRMPGKWLLRHVACFLMRQRIRDLNCGFRAFRTDVIRRHMHLCPNGFSFSLTSTLILVSERYDVAFVPLDVEERVGRSTVRVSDGLASLLNVLRIIMLFDPLRVLLLPSAVCLILGAISFVYDLVSINIRQATLLLVLSGILFFFFGLLADQVAAVRKEIR